MPNFTEDNLQRILTNPFYTITAAPQLTQEHEPTMEEAEWVRVNASLMGEMGSGRWLQQMLDTLEGKAGTPDQRINPFHAVNIAPLFAVGHSPLIERDMWVEVNVMQIRNLGVEEWLMHLLDVLNGDIVTVGEVGFASPGSSNAQRWGKKKRKKRHRK